MNPSPTHRPPRHYYLVVITIIIAFSYVHPASAITPDAQIGLFLAKDTTDTHEYLPWYTCGHYARDLSRNASLHNISIGSCMLGYHPTFRGHQNHIVNYIEKDGKIILIEPQTDRLMTLSDTMFNYYRLWIDGTQIPTYRRGNYAPTGIIP